MGLLNSSMNIISIQVNCCLLGCRQQFTYYRAIRYPYSAVFAVASCPSVSLSDSPSVTLVHHGIHTAEDIVKLLCRPGSRIIPVFWPTAPVPNSNENPFSWDAKYKGWGNFEIFDWNRRLSRKRYEITPWLLWNGNKKSYALYRMVTFSITLTDP